MSCISMPSRLELILRGVSPRLTTQTYCASVRESHRYADVTMAYQIIPPLRLARVFEIRFPSFTPRITIHSERELTVEIVAGDNVGFSDTVAYEAISVREGLIVLSWQERIGSTIVHVLDFASGRAYTAVTPMKGGFMRLMGPIDVKSV